MERHTNPDERIAHLEAQVEALQAERKRLEDEVRRMRRLYESDYAVGLERV